MKVSFITMIVMVTTSVHILVWAMSFDLFYLQMFLWFVSWRVSGRRKHCPEVSERCTSRRTETNETSHKRKAIHPSSHHFSVKRLSWENPTDPTSIRCSFGLIIFPKLFEDMSAQNNKLTSASKILVPAILFIDTVEMGPHRNHRISRGSTTKMKLPYHNSMRQWLHWNVLFFFARCSPPMAWSLRQLVMMIMRPCLNVTDITVA